MGMSELKVILARRRKKLTALVLRMTNLNSSTCREELKAAVEAKITLETEMKKLRVQTEQWQKAASEAASVLAGEVEVGGQKVAAQSSSLGKHVGFELVGYGGFDSLEDFDEELESGKRKGSGIRMFGDLWKKKGQK
ncbi:hypothetical protein MRB53_036019 [Persea americana]|uniref:Uncharacterized protein n=1 Tax=Persea americana TaxID=3435 RepID=A0ACC2K6B1_PERAE|nr:hypothetical protein MRB53_036019 [Persea americana]